MKGQEELRFRLAASQGYEKPAVVRLDDRRLVDVSDHVHLPPSRRASATSAASAGSNFGPHTSMISSAMSISSLRTYAGQSGAGVVAIMSIALVCAGPSKSSSAS